jgi:hypothetical protein
MKKIIAGFIAGIMAVGAASAETVNVTDAGTTLYGSTDGVAVDFDASAATLADWVPDLADGTTYSVDSLSLRLGAANANTVYLGVYSGLSGTTLSGFLGASDNAINLSTATVNDWMAFTFTGINVTADSTVGSGSGLLYFLFQTDAVAHATNPDLNISTHRMNVDTTMSQSLASIYALGAIQAARAPEYQANLTVVPEVVPEPSTFALLGLAGAAFLGARRRSVK